MSRQAAIEQFRSTPRVSVLIIGGGVNGIGTFRDLALQGVDVLLVEKGDFCSAASAANSHMVHGGLRYLENGEFRLVREALKERNLLLRNAPHSVRPLPTTIPIFHWMGGFVNATKKFLRLSAKPTNRGALIIKIGLLMYDLFTYGEQTLPRHRFHSRSSSLKLRPKLNPRIVATATYYDAWMPLPERICLEMILDAEAASPRAHALNYVCAEGAAGDSVLLRDELSGAAFSVRPQVVINATGAWIDFTNKDIGRPTRFIGGTKGAHLVVAHDELREATHGHEVFFENRDGRIVLIFPIGDRVLMGTTDIPIEDPEEARCSDAEVDYILAAARHVFPDIRVKRSHIVFRFSGVRPLPASDVATPGQISRDHSIRTIAPGEGLAFPIHSLVGGKWTTFRAFSEQITDKILAELGLPRRISTAQLAIGGGKDYPETDEERETWLAALHEKTGLPRGRLQTLFDRYGTRAAAVVDYLAGGEDAPLKHLPDYSRREIEFIAMREKVAHLEDVVLRRTLLALLGRLSGATLTELAQVVGEALGWPRARMEAEIERVIATLRDRHDVVIETAAAPSRLRT